MVYFLKVTTASPEAQAIQENLAAIISSNHASDSISVKQMMPPSPARSSYKKSATFLSKVAGNHELRPHGDSTIAMTTELTT